MPAVNVCIIEQEPEAPGGLLTEWAQARGHGVVVLRVPDVDEWPDPREYGLIAPLGSECSVHASTDEWIPQQIDFLRSAHEAGVPVLGICFGGQALAAALGADVWKAEKDEIGWLEIEALDGGELAPGPWFVWHSDTFAFPAGAEQLARTPAAAQAFRLGNSVGLQFHPEVTPEILDMWITSGRESLERQGIDADALKARLLAEEDDHRERAFALFDTIAAGWTEGPPTNVQN
jgi:GMP synthase-like glutamine amidotransferase